MLDAAHEDSPTPDSRTATTVADSIIYVDFKDNDPRNPMNFSRKKKWFITLLACFSTIVSSTTSTSYNMGFPSMNRDLQASNFQATVGLAVYSVGFGVVPLFTAPFSEELGRRPLYLGSLVALLLFYIPIAMAKNIVLVQVARFLQGSVASTGAIMVGGTIADIWAPQDRTLPMALSTLMVIGGNGLGPVFGGWIEFNGRLGWRWIHWIQMILCGVCLLLIPLMGETRSNVILTKIARRTRKETGDARYRALAEVERQSLKSMIWISCTRPLRLLFTEPIVASFSLWIGFAWGVLFVLVASIAAVFRDLHRFHVGQVGTVFSAMVLGSFIGFAITVGIQNPLYLNNFKKRGVEARLYSACLAGVIFPIAMSIYGASCSSTIHWIGLLVGITLFSSAVYMIYASVFTYLADCYGPYASSALAGQSLFRNVLGTVFPLFTHQMYSALTYRWANLLFAGIALLLMPIPFVLFIYGPALRERSPFSKKIAVSPATLEQESKEQLEEKDGRN
ncbi:drug transporter [Coprinopsis cinerea okayama7|uniref:Drug transporter n=1 Tax=Coprinopsis cinerea (strain Okayama-7 / 130 / ATCC MYA-4618 / FGSC 9003) TaxID=240176 RepID=A8NA00_COPC7|nr:drug transporter [Coprinopsis cinerea okayama7\|eukprot:XP_001831656.2 drug transporter [Coprinopsis cinerea okayama7\